MNETYYNGKYNIITTDMDLVKEVFRIKRQELDNDEVFSGNLILNKKFDNLDKDKIFSLPLDENTIYVNDVNYSANWKECEIDDSIVYCGSFVLWLLGNQHRSPVNLFGQMRQHRIKVKKIWDSL
tara:strand:+ start:1469 stop:1843 length:375 start_codon:yes stop_codon:yes gene_type:complete